MLMNATWTRPLALFIVVLVPVLAVAAPLWCFATGMW
jgi:hypothetical protein